MLLCLCSSVGPAVETAPAVCSGCQPAAPPARLLCSDRTVGAGELHFSPTPPPAPEVRHRAGLLPHSQAQGLVRLQAHTRLGVGVGVAVAQSRVAWGLMPGPQLPGPRPEDTLTSVMYL